MNRIIPQIEFIDEFGSFRLKNPTNIHELYFPLCNKSGLMSSVTPTLHGDIKIDQHHFALAPVSVVDLHNTRSARNFWVYFHGKGAFSATGNSARQNSLRFTGEDKSERTIEAGPLWHKLIYHEPLCSLTFEITSFVPSNDDLAELMCISIINNGEDEVTFTPTSAIPLYARSADNLRDHRHVTSLVNRLTYLEHGIAVKPEIVFDERGHKYNNIIYYTIGAEESGTPPIGSIGSLQDFIGSAGTLDWPEAVVANLSPDLFKDKNIDGLEYVGAIRFNDCTLKPGQKKNYILITGICDQFGTIDDIREKYCSLDKFNNALAENRKYWEDLSDKTAFSSGIDNFTEWMRWVSLQPVFRKIYGCSFLPYHDYGRGGRGWRDLWQDCLSLILLEPKDVRQILVDNFGGVRVDGTNATIIGTKPGEFIADRNNIARVWMDHGTWPYLTTRLYIDQSGDFEILNEKQTYFRDALILRASSRDESWDESYGLKQRCNDGSVYTGTLLEHMLVQHLASFFNVGEHNIILLEGADWNDTLDMARQRGESTAFTALYGSNLMGLAELITEAKNRLGMEYVEVFEELAMLLDTLNSCPDYDSIDYKKALLKEYLKTVSKGLSGRTVKVSVQDLAKDLRTKGEWIFDHLRKYEFITTKDKDGFFNGYYNNDGQRVDGDFPEGVRMNLTAQVFTTMFGLADKNQVEASYLSCRKYLKDPVTGGYRLNTPLGPNKLNFGRGFAFAYGEKENGATFCHMAVMYMNALYRRGFVKEAFDIFNSLFELSNNYTVSGIYPGIPEYFNSAGKGMYHYLTGSASWLLMTVLTQMYGIRGEFGNLVIEPKLLVGQFDSRGYASCKANFRGRRITVNYVNSKGLDYGVYKISGIKICGVNFDKCIISSSSVRIPGQDIDAFKEHEINIDIVLDNDN